MADAIRIIGIDPGLRRTGWGIVDVRGNALRFVAAGTLKSDDKADLASRLCQIHDGLVAVLDGHRPDEAAVEQTFVNRDGASTLKLGQARGAALAAVPATLDVHEYAPRAIKLAVVGVGGAEKAQVAHMVRQLLRVEARLTPDAADALALAICHVVRGGTRSKLAAAADRVRRGGAR